MTKFIDITGKRFGRLIAIKPVGPDAQGKMRWLCRCRCSRDYIAIGNKLRDGRATSCGCRPANYRHGHAIAGKIHPLYYTWINIHRRCNDPKITNYKYYGARGIKVDPRWTDFAIFLADVGERPHPNLTLDRIDNNGDYTPLNVRWATKKEQRTNSRPHPKNRRSPITRFTTAELKAELTRRRK